MSASEPRPKFRVAICGAGIGGLILAITIGKYDPSVPIDLYEAHDSISTAGVGITLWKQVHEVMFELGLVDDFEQILAVDPESSRGPHFRRSDNPQGGYLWYQKDHDLPTSMHRQQLLAVLEKHLPASCTVHLGKRLVDYAESKQQDASSTLPMRLEFTDGTIATADVLIGADGVRSAVRKSLFETAASADDRSDAMDFKQYVDASFTGMLSYRFLVSADDLRKENPENRSLRELNAYCGKGRYLFAYPIANGTLVNVLAVISDPNLRGSRYEGHWVTDATREEVVDRFDDFEPEAKQLVKRCENPSKWALHVVKRLPFCVRKRVALVGDACHAMTPHHGAGAGQAIDSKQDAFVLGRLVAHPLTTLARIPRVLRIYEEIRFRFAQTVARYSLSTGWMYLFMEPGYYDGTRREEDVDDRGIGAYEREGMETMKREVLRRWKWMDDSQSAVQTWADAERKLQALEQ